MFAFNILNLALVAKVILLPKMHVSAFIFEYEDESSAEDLPNYFHIVSSPEEYDFQETLINEVKVHSNYITESEERTLLDEIDEAFHQIRYESSDVFGYTADYRQVEKTLWNSSANIIKKIKNFVFPPGHSRYDFEQVVDYQPSGFMRSHIDDEETCGNIVAGLSLLSDCVMRLAYEDDRVVTLRRGVSMQRKDRLIIVDVLLKRRSLYVMKDTMRYKFTHEILNKDDSLFKGKRIQRGRRIAVMFRNKFRPS